MSAASRSGRAEAQPARRTLARKTLSATAFLFVFATTMGGAFAGVFLMLRLGDSTPLSSLMHEDGRGGLVAGGIVLGASIGAFAPFTLFEMVRGDENNPRLGGGAAARRALGVLAFDVYVFVLALVVSLLGWILPAVVTNLVGVFVIGFSWVPLGLFPWEKVGLGGVVGIRRPGSRGPSVSLRKD
uniref:Integral membrane protein n=1 Tax=Streptomyces sp. NBC_00093 TaxID=2975649 RepID=A0AAU2A7A9_9ACTN